MNPRRSGDSFTASETKKGACAVAGQAALLIPPTEGTDLEGWPLGRPPSPPQALCPPPKPLLPAEHPLPEANFPAF
jgi:hypothetical protein